MILDFINSIFDVLHNLVELVFGDASAALEGLSSGSSAAEVPAPAPEPTDPVVQ